MVKIGKTDIEMKMKFVTTPKEMSRCFLRISKGTGVHPKNNVEVTIQDLSYYSDLVDKSEAEVEMVDSNGNYRRSDIKQHPILQSNIFAKGKVNQNPENFIVVLFQEAATVTPIFKSHYQDPSTAINTETKSSQPHSS